VQLDGAGWTLWALGQVAAALPADQGRQLVVRHRRLLDRSTAAALAAIDNPDALPPPSSDYWEVSERRPTLATAALLRSGLQTAGRLYESVSNRPTGQAVDAAADRLSAAIARRFGPEGYPRRLGGRPDSVDLGVGFLLPPFGDGVDAAAVRAWRHGALVMARPAGGLAPGGSWRLDGVSWTTATSSYALTAACLGDRDAAVRWLRWLDAHRTPSGSLPEKVTAAGEPAAVAPLAWAAAAVVLTADQLRG
jgi:GH15 family glucan-1,4-alpha-glucosidase